MKSIVIRLIGNLISLHLLKKQSFLASVYIYFSLRICAKCYNYIYNSDVVNVETIFLEHSTLFMKKSNKFI